MTTENKPKRDNDKTFIDLWPSAKTHTPALVVKLGHVTTSKMLLIHDEKRGVVPGYYQKWNQDYHQQGKEPIKKGDCFYIAVVDDTVLNDVVAFYQLDKILPSKKTPKPGEETQTPAE